MERDEIWMKRWSFRCVRCDLI